MGEHGDLSYTILIGQTGVPGHPSYVELCDSSGENASPWRRCLGFCGLGVDVNKGGSGNAIATHQQMDDHDQQIDTLSKKIEHALAELHQKMATDRLMSFWPNTHQASLH